ncbi:MAG TPA: exodeoxyribonuclease VII small subunit [Candidatus Binatia bacterium]
MAGNESLNQTFETALEQLEQIVERLESGELSLEDSLAAFEAGVGLVKHCNQKLNEVEKKIELLVRDKEGKLQLKDFPELAKSEKQN